MSKVQPVMIIPMPEREWGCLSEETQNVIRQIEQRTCEFIRHIYSSQPEIAEEILGRIGLKAPPEF
jgi:hypothetical protein